jgi:hypothetical protein
MDDARVVSAMNYERLVAAHEALAASHARLQAAAKAVEAHLVSTFPPYPAGESPFDKLRAAIRSAV